MGSPGADLYNSTKGQTARFAAAVPATPGAALYHSTAPPPKQEAKHHKGGFLNTLEDVGKTALDVITLGGSGATSLGPGYLPQELSAPVHVGANLLKDAGDVAVGVVPGGIKLAKDTAEFLYQTARHPERKQTAANSPLLADLAAMGKQYAGYYGHDQLHHLYTHPLQPIIDAVTVVSAGVGGAARVAKLADAIRGAATPSQLAQLGEVEALVTRSPRNIATGKGPVHMDLSSPVPQVKIRQKAANTFRAAHPEGIKIPGTTVRIGGEAKLYGSQIQAGANRTALQNLHPLTAYQKATKRLSADEWTALHIRAMDIHPDDLRDLWRGTPKETELTGKVRQLVLHPTPRMKVAEPAARALSEHGADLLKGAGKLRDDTADARPELTKKHAAEVLERPVRPITGDPYYFPHQLEPQPSVSPLAANGGGKGVPNRLGSTRQNTGALALTGKIHLRSDVLGPEFARRVKFVKYDEIHNALVRGAVRLTPDELDALNGGKLPEGYEYLREKASTKIPATVKVEGEHVPLDKLVPNPDDLHDSPLAEGFSTTDRAKAHTSGGRYYIIPKSTVKAATGEFTRSSNVTRLLVNKPLSIWRALVLGTRVGFLTNNLVGNSLMYAVRTGGKGALRDLLGAIIETHGRETGLKALRSAATPPELRADLMREFFPEQVHGTFGRTQTPSTSPAHLAGHKLGEGFRAATGAIPKLTSKVAEEYPRRALLRHFIRNSPEFRKVYHALPRQTRSFEQAARMVLEGKGGAAYQRRVSKQVNHALGDYLHLSPMERNVLRNALPFYSWYRAITTTTMHLAVDTPLRANILGQIGRIGKEQSDEWLGAVPSFLEGAIGLGHGPGGTKRVLGTGGLNPYATLNQLGRGSMTDYSALGLNPFIQGPLDYVKGAHGNISPAALLASPLGSLVKHLPPSQLISPPGPSALYPNRHGLTPQVLAWLGVPIKEFDPAVAAKQKAAGR